MGRSSEVSRNWRIDAVAVVLDNQPLTDQGGRLGHIFRWHIDGTFVGTNLENCVESRPRDRLLWRTVPENGEQSKMRLIGVVDEPQQAARFSAYLITAGIPAKSEKLDDGTCEIWVNEEDQFQAAVAEMAAFRADPTNSKYSAAISLASKITRDEERRFRRIRKKIVVGTGRLQPKPRLTIGLIVACVLVALITNFGEDRNNRLFQSLLFVSVPAPQSIEILQRNNVTRDNDGIDKMAVRLASIERGEIWRLITPMLIHLSPFHLLFNMVWMFQLGQLIERRYSWHRLAWLVLLTALISNFVQCTVPLQFDGTGPGMLENGTLITAFGGMSGVVYGLFGFVWVKSLYDRSSGFFLPQLTIVLMLGWLVFCMVPGLTERLLGFSVANWAHGVGLVVGMAVAYAPIGWANKK